jgi:hypothetical protein
MRTNGPRSGAAPPQRRRRQTARPTPVRAPRRARSLTYPPAPSTGRLALVRSGARGVRAPRPSRASQKAATSARARRPGRLILPQ